MHLCVPVLQRSGQRSWLKIPVQAKNKLRKFQCLNRHFSAHLIEGFDLQNAAKEYGENAMPVVLNFP